MWPYQYYQSRKRQLWPQPALSASPAEDPAWLASPGPAPPHVSPQPSPAGQPGPASAPAPPSPALGSGPMASLLFSAQPSAPQLLCELAEAPASAPHCYLLCIPSYPPCSDWPAWLTFCLLACVASVNLIAAEPLTRPALAPQWPQLTLGCDCDE